jgi:hypothetical protein
LLAKADFLRPPFKKILVAKYSKYNFF